MSNRTRYSIVKGILPDQVRGVIAETVQAFPGPRPHSSHWSDWQQVVRLKEMTAAIYDGGLVVIDDAWWLADKICRRVDSPYLELRAQEGDHWDFTVYYRGKVIADFSTRVAYFDSDVTASRPWKQGDANAFCTCWGVPLEQVEPYLVDWDSCLASGRARRSDEYPIGDCRQIFDFMRAIKVADPEEHPERFTFSVPVWGEAYVRQSWWRRAVRRVSVWIKGTFPDVPRLTEEERSQWRLRQGSVQVVRADLNQLLEDEQQPK